MPISLNTRFLDLGPSVLSPADLQELRLDLQLGRLHNAMAVYSKYGIRLSAADTMFSRFTGRPSEATRTLIGEPVGG